MDTSVSVLPSCSGCFCRQLTIRIPQKRLGDTYTLAISLRKMTDQSFRHIRGPGLRHDTIGLFSPLGFGNLLLPRKADTLLRSYPDKAANFPAGTRSVFLPSVNLRKCHCLRSSLHRKSPPDIPSGYSWSWTFLLHLAPAGRKHVLFRS